MKTVVVLFGGLVLTGALAPPAQAGEVRAYQDKAAFLAATSATSATGPLPDVGMVLDVGIDPLGTYTLGSLTFSLTEGSDNLAVGAVGTPAAPDWYPLTPQNEMALGFERMQVATGGLVYSFGFDFIEPNVTMPPFGGTPVESTYEILLFKGPALVGQVRFEGADIPNDVQTFLGVWSDQPFDRIVINDVTGDDDDEFFGEFFTGVKPAGCTVKVDLSYAGGTFTMNVELGTATPRTWNAWLVYGASSQARLLSIPLPSVTPTLSFPISFPLPSLGRVGLLTTMATASEGISCSDFKTVSTVP
jgi:hypothetical protein